MKYSAIAAAALAGFATAAPTVQKRKAAITDADILNYALTLEHLEDKFYREGLANYTHKDFLAAGFADPFYQNLMEVSVDETTHVSFLTTALTAAGATPVAECNYSFPATDPKSFVALASVLEGVGVSAYLGAAADITAADYLTAAGSILTVEARHSAYIRAALAEAPFASPFDTPLDFDEVYTLAAPFIVSCPASNPALPVKAFPSLAVGTTGTISANTTITLKTPGYVLQPANGVSQLYGAFITVTGPIFVPATAVDGGFSVVVPKGVAGQTYVVLTGCNEAVNDDTVAAGPAIVEVASAAGA
ncbi:MAG: hypothetical protein FRX48_02476 [Lasallia pustulata]|uniref:Ferritin-related n=1 Tax=Lasallia pustulata TaxID=136370 RepID=A0A1W5DBR0_9LECA|nr:MAG: hypothetical protein FRX48_02476 [Lasallia pustulata]SLM40465.1 Ferritin-related [Lasallia pustulata]